MVLNSLILDRNSRTKHSLPFYGNRHRYCFTANGHEKRGHEPGGEDVKRILGIIPFLFLLSTAEAAYLDLAWDPNTEPDLAGYRVYYGTESRAYIDFVDVGKVTAYCLDSLLEGVTYYISITAYDTAGNESDFSGEVSGIPVPGEPAPVGGGPETASDSSIYGGCFVSSLTKPQ